MKQIKRFLSTLLITAILSSTFTFSAYAGDGSGNMDGGGGDMGGGTSQNVWHNGDDGVRVTVVRASDNKPVSTPFDMTNRKESDAEGHFIKKCKLTYRNGSSLIIDTGKYVYVNPSNPMPTVITGNNTNNIAAIKKYFCSSETVKKIAQIVGCDFDKLTDGTYKLLLEPVAYFTFQGHKYAMTATEAAKYDLLASGELRRKMVSLSHQNLPLSMFLEHPDMGYPAFPGKGESTSKPQFDTTIINKLGLGIVKFKDSPGPEPVNNNYDVTYRTNTDVVTSVVLGTNSQIDPDSPAKVTFHILGSSYTRTGIVIPEGESQLVWVKWHTPSTPQKVIISVSASKGSLSDNKVTADVVKLEEKTPPDPTAKDRNNSFKTPDIPEKAQCLANSWSVWSAKWVPNWVWHEHWVWEEHKAWSSGGKWVDKGKWIDEGNWEFINNSFSASLSADMDMEPDDKDPTAKGKTMKSGYGVKISIKSSAKTSGSSQNITGAQTAVTYFPEFEYATYWRVLDRMTDGLSATFAFQKNIYSTYNRRVHFTPLWYPDGQYTAYTVLEDAWTPAGMLSKNLTDYTKIDGNVYDDWHEAPMLVN